MAFRGIYPAQELVHLEFGLFSAAVVRDDVDRDMWVRGFSYEFNTRPTLRLVQMNGASPHTIFDGSGLARFQEVESFYVEVEDFRSTFAANNEDRFVRVKNQLEAATQKAVEQELWNGYVARGEGNSNDYLTKPGLATMASTTPSTAVSPADGLAFLESSLSNHPVGEQGMIHLSRDMAAHLGSQWLLMRVEDDPGHFHIETINGTTVSIGSGNTGDGPFAEVSNKELTSNVATITTSTAHYLSAGEKVRVVGVGAPFDGEFVVASVPTPTTFTYAKTASNVSSASDTGLCQMVGTNTVKWIYSTHKVEVLLGEIELVTDSYAQAYDVSGNQNDLRVKAMRPAAVYFDPSMTYAVKVDITA